MTSSCAIVSCAGILACTLVYIAVYNSSSSSIFTPAIGSIPRRTDYLRVRSPRRPILIYAATAFFSAEITTETYVSGCAAEKDWCSISCDIGDFSRAAAVLLHNRDINESIVENVTEKRHLDIPYIIMSWESPSNEVWEVPANFINWTMTYRRDADVWYPYGHIARRSSSIIVDFDRIWSGMNESLPPAAWLASNCEAPNGRSEIVRKLEESGLEIDKWGACGTPVPDCARYSHGPDCTQKLLRPYKFYIAFENSNCVDYVTEKFYNTMSQRQSVPIVLIRNIYENLGIPSSSFIALSDYSSLSEAVKEINRIAADKNAYLEYHKWREEYEFHPWNSARTGFCELCRKLAERSHLSPQERLSSRKSYSSVQNWHSDHMCDNSIKFN